MYKKITFTLACLLAVGTISACADVEVNEPDGQLESLQQQIATLESELEEERNRVPETVVVPLSDEHNSLQDSIAAVEQERDDLSAELDILENEVLALQLERDDIQQEYDDFQASMAPFVELSPEQAEAILLALDEEEAARQAEAAEKEKLGYETGITYDQLARTPDDYVGDLVKFTGEVLQVTEGDGYAHYRIAVNGNYDQVLFVQIDSSLTQNNRILEDDEITIFGESYGLHTYQSAFKMVY